MNNKTHKRCVLLVLGMAGSGKSTFTQRVIAEAEEREYELKSVNLDPAVGGGKSEDQEEEEEVEEGFEDWCYGIPYEPNVDIRDSIDYKKLMKGNELGPNGAIMLSLNMYSTRLNDLSAVVERWRDNKVDFVCVDTPGQIEVFTWSASGTLFTEMFARIMPTVLVFVVDTVSMQSASTFVSVLFHACGVMLRTQLPMVLVFNKTDLRPAEEQFVWMEDLDALQTALDEESDDTQYMANLSSSVSLMMHEFLDSIHKCAVSSVTGEGMDEFFLQVQLAANEFEDGKVEDEAPTEQQPVARPFAAPTLQDLGETFVDKPAAVQQQQEEEEALPLRMEELSLQKTKQLNAEAYLKRKYADFDSEEQPSKRAPATAQVFWFCSQCELENAGAFCSQCLECSPALPAWFCSTCHIENTGAVCKACMSDAPLVGTSDGPASGPVSKRRSSSVAMSSSTSRRSSQISKLPNWTCLSCTYFNTHGGGTCEMCGMSQLTNNQLKQQHPDLLWSCPQCKLDIHRDTKSCPQCSTTAVAEDKKEKAVTVAAAPFKDGEIVEDMIWSEKEARFFPLNATRDGRFDETQVKVTEEEEEEVSYDYEDDVDG